MPIVPGAYRVSLTENDFLPLGLFNFSLAFGESYDRIKSKERPICILGRVSVCNMGDFGDFVLDPTPLVAMIYGF